MSNQQNDKKIKELLAKFCLENQVQPFEITEQDLKNAKIKRGESWERINADEYKNLQGESLKLRVKNNRQEIEEIMLKKATNFNIDSKNPNDKNINILGQDDNHNPMICSTLDFLEIYQIMYDQRYSLTEKIDAIEMAAEDVGKPLIFISNATIFDQNGEVLAPEEVRGGDVIDLEGPMTDRYGDEVCDYVEDAKILAGMTDTSTGYDLTVLVAEDAIYVHIGQERELLLEKVMSGDDYSRDATERFVQLITTSGEIVIETEIGFDHGK